MTSPHQAVRPGANPTPRILVFGDILDDIIVIPESEPTPNTDTVSRIQHRAGGSAANTAAWLGSQGAAVDFVGRVGVGDVERHSQLLANAGVTPLLAHDAHDSTGTVIITVDGPYRTMFTDRGASAGLSFDRISDELIEGVSIVHFTGYNIVHDRSSVAFRRLVARIRAAGALVSIDPASSGFIADYGADAFLDLVEGADLFFPNLDEGRLLTGLTDADEIVQALLPRFGVVAAPLPDRSAVAGRQGTKLAHAAPVAARLVDPIGAGDAYVAGFLSSWLSSSSVAIANRRGVKLMAQSFSVVGGRPLR
jgi:sugar/nucleoside kinase (ribokinase family)